MLNLWPQFHKHTGSCWLTSLGYLPILTLRSYFLWPCAQVRGQRALNANVIKAAITLSAFLSRLPAS